MPIGEPIKEQILSDIEATIRSITGGADYYYTIEKVLRLDTGALQLNSFPGVVIVPTNTGYDNSRSTVVGVVAGSFEIILSCYLRTATNVAKSVERLIRDVHTALYVDITRGGLAINTRVLSDDIFYPDDAVEPVCGADIRIMVDYRARRTNLNSSAT